MNDAEREWVANTVHAVSGIHPQYLCGSDAADAPAMKMTPATQPARICGVYFLYWRGELMYIGKSENIYSRLAAHMQRAPFEFDEFRVEGCAARDLIKNEAQAIRSLEPKWNRDYPAHLAKIFERRGPFADR